MLKSPAIVTLELPVCRYSSNGINSLIKAWYKSFVLRGGLYTLPMINVLFVSIFEISINWPSHI